MDQARAEAFSARIMGLLNEAGLALMTSIGHRVGLFDVLSRLPPSTSEAIAVAAGLHERYVREWLSAMVTGRIVDYDPGAGTFALPAEHAACLTRGAGLGNLALQTQYVPMAAQVEDAIIDCFQRGGGVPYSAYPRMQRIMAEESGAANDAFLVDTVLPLVPGLIPRLEAGLDVADVGCGRGHAINVMARAFPRSRFVGFDFSQEGIAAGTDEARRLGLGNARFELRDAATLDVRTAFDLVTAFDAIHDQVHPARVLRGIAEALRPGGTFLMVDIKASSKLEENLDHVLGTFFYTISCMHCMTVSLSGGGTGLGTMWGRQLALRMLGEAGFSRVEVADVDGDYINSYYIAAR